jgi:uncharacterized protein (TIGR03083 family)
MGAEVPACPGWRVRDLLKHTGYVHRWAAGYVTDGLTEIVGEPSEEAILGQGPADDELPGWFREGHAALVRAIETADPDIRCWSFLPAPSPLAFWARRQAHETAIHRVDADQAAAQAGGREADGGPPFEPGFAADGVDELIMGFLARNIGRGRWPGLGGTLAIHAGDGPAGRAGWLVTGGSGAAGVARGAGPADCEVTGPAADLYLLLWNRRPAQMPRVSGDPGILAEFGKALNITWH